MPANASKLARLALAATVSLSGAVATTAATAVFGATSAHAATTSSVDGPITRSEIIQRAQYWLGKSIPYNQGGSYGDSSGRSYRTDCSGYVSMAWHLGSSLSTQTLPGVATEISRSDLKPGDILNSFYDHVLLFEKWDDAAHTTFSYYSFGSTPVKHVTGQSINAATFDSHPNGDYKALRYKKVINGSAGTESGGAGRARFADFDGDGKADYILVEDSGAIRVFLNKGGDGHGGWQDLGQVASGLTNDKSRVRFADFDGDGKADYIVIQPNGAVGVFKNNGGDGRGGWQDLGQVATGLTTDPDQVRFADFDGDGKADYVMTQADGSVGVFRNTNGAGGWQDLGKVAGGVTSDRSRIRWADINGDGRADYNIINPDGSITSYTNNGGDTGGGWTLRAKIASGLTTNQNVVHFADVTGDGSADYLVVNGPTNAFAYNGGDDTGGGWIDLGQIAAGV
ncbi:FG-GAP-like repeat-containing protein [Kitasatospora sp. NPDC051984]|uniref:C40 family peptidase n=1 Tax=Kitasatospora sp. NPDC051984 TaxID=3364059 RepID=UPI0037CBC18B